MASDTPQTPPGAPAPPPLAGGGLAGASGAGAAAPGGLAKLLLVLFGKEAAGYAALLVFSLATITGSMYVLSSRESDLAIRATVRYDGGAFATEGSADFTPDTGVRTVIISFDNGVVSGIRDAVTSLAGAIRAVSSNIIDEARREDASRAAAQAARASTFGLSTDTQLVAQAPALSASAVQSLAGGTQPTAAPAVQATSQPVVPTAPGGPPPPAGATAPAGGPTAAAGAAPTTAPPTQAPAPAVATQAPVLATATSAAATAAAQPTSTPTPIPPTAAPSATDVPSSGGGSQPTSAPSGPSTAPTSAPPGQPQQPVATSAPAASTQVAPTAVSATAVSATAVPAATVVLPTATPNVAPTATLVPTPNATATPVPVSLNLLAHAGINSCPVCVVAVFNGLGNLNVGDTVYRELTVTNTGAVPYSLWVHTTCNACGGANPLWNDPVNGVQLKVHRNPGRPPFDWLAYPTGPVRIDAANKVKIDDFLEGRSSTVLLELTLPVHASDTVSNSIQGVVAPIEFVFTMTSLS